MATDALSKIVIIFSGVLFAISWWMIIDQTYFVKSFYNGPGDFRWFFFLAPIVSTLGIFLIWFISRNSIFEGKNSLAAAFGDDDSVTQRILLFIFLAILISGAPIATYFHTTLNIEKIDIASKNASIAIIIGSIGISTSGIILKFCRPKSKRGIF